MQPFCNTVSNIKRPKIMLLRVSVMRRNKIVSLSRETVGCGAYIV